MDDILKTLQSHGHYVWGLVAALAMPLVVAVRKPFARFVQTVARAFSNNAQLVKTNLVQQGQIEDLERRVNEERDRADYWQDSRTELTERIDDLEARLKDAAERLTAMVHDMVDIRQKLTVGEERIRSLSADREALLVYSLAAQTELSRMGVDIGVTFPALNGRSMNILSPEKPASI